AQGGRAAAGGRGHGAGGAEGDGVTGGDRCRAVDPSVVDEGAVGRAEVLDHEPAGGGGQPAVPGGDSVAGGDEVTVRGPADEPGAGGRVGVEEGGHSGRPHGGFHGQGCEGQRLSLATGG